MKNKKLILIITFLLCLIFPCFVVADTTSGWYDPATTILKSNRTAIGTAIAGSAVTATLYVSPNGTNTNGLSWITAYTTIQAALDAASTDGDDLTLIMISPHTTNYDINTTGDPTWAANVILQGSSSTWAKIKNTHASATSIMKFTGKVGIFNLNFNLGSGSINGIIITKGGYYISNCMFVGEDLTGAATALHLDGATVLKHGQVSNKCMFLGNSSHMTAILLDNVSYNHLEHIHIHECKTGIQIINSDSDGNIFEEIDIGDTTLAIDIDAGNEQEFVNTYFHSCTTNIDDEVGDHIYSNLFDNFDMCVCPDDMSGVTLTAGADANAWGSNTEVRAAATSTTPFRIVGYVVSDLSATQKYKIRFSNDNGTSYFDEIMIENTKQAGADAPSGTEKIFNYNTQIVASTKAESGGNDTIAVWIKVQEI